MTSYYLDTSVALRILLGDSPAAALWFEDAVESPADSVISSRVLRTEMTRALRRLRQPIDRRSQILDFVGLVPLDHAMLQEAEAIVPHIKTLDAIHLASALRSGVEDLVIATHDRNMRSIAEELGFEILDPVTDDAVQD
ncbi:type II toxin-antitoxin system VapC family toxin [Nesterenkonia alba]|uniref:type II toxin-antitoxin system VapC family toxin n=1 Tax=Nesterenkonia alba TaxID=515814 RepID=UPI0004210F27|nr:type II toxin-antitoxin system VapC family toxin [Nesterenkonia alba]